LKVKNKWTGKFYEASPDGKRWKMTREDGSVFFVETSEFNFYYVKVKEE